MYFLVCSKTGNPIRTLTTKKSDMSANFEPGGGLDYELKVWGGFILLWVFSVALDHRVY